MAFFQDTTLVELLCRRASRQPNQKLYTFLVNGEQEGSSLTYGELDRQARRVASLLQEHHAQGERVLLLYPPGLDFIAAFFGCLYAGAIAVPAYPPRNKRHLPRIQLIVEDAQATCLLTVEKTRSKIETWLDQHAFLRSLRIHVTDTLAEERELHWKEPDITGQSLAFLQYTSGSTSAPKGVMVRHQHLLHNSAQICRSFEHTLDSRVVSWLPPYHDMGLIGGILQPFFVGFQAVLMAPTAFLQRPLRWLEAISRYQATSSGGPNFAYDLCSNKITPEQRETLDLRSWRVAFNGSEPIQAATLEHFAAAFHSCGFRKEAFYPCYGLAESTLFVSGGKVGALPVAQTFQTTALERKKILAGSDEIPDEKQQTLIGAGQNLDGQTIAIVHPDTCTRCAPDEIGEIWLASSSVAGGYWNRPEITKQSFQATLSDSGEGPFLRTGDLGFFQDGELFIAGRMKDLIIIRGRNHYPQDLERTVEASHSVIRHNCSAAFSLTVEGKEQLVVAAEVERRYRFDPHVPASAATDRQHQHDRRQMHQAPVDLGFITDHKHVFNPDDVVNLVRQAIAEQHELQVYGVILLKFGTIPRTSSGKIQRHACKAKFQEQTLETVAEWFHTPSRSVSLASQQPEARDTESATAQFTTPWEPFLAKLWAQELDLDQTTLHPDSQFFQLGGDSLHATTLLGLISDAVGAELDPDLLHQHPTLGTLAMYCGEEYGLPPETVAKDTLLPRLRRYCHPERPHFPLLPLQQSFFIGRTIGDIAIYVVLDIELQGELHVELFQQAFHLLIKRHPALRLAFRSSNGTEPIQQVSPPEPSINTLQTEDLRHLSPQARLERLDREAATLAAYSFRNDLGETVSGKLFVMDASTYRLLINFDHLAIDGYSLSKVFEDLHAMYCQLLDGSSVNDTPQTSLSFKEYVEIHTTHQDPEQRERDIAYWLEKIPQFEPFPEIGPAEECEGGDHFETYLSALKPAVVSRLREHARTHGVTFFSMLMAAFLKLLALRTGSNRLTINTPYLNRRPYAHDVQEMIGCFTDILPIRAEELLESPLLELAHTVHRSLAEMHRHSSISGVELARLLAQKHQVAPQTISPIILSSALFPLERMSSPDTYKFSSVRVQTGAPATFIDVVVYEACGQFLCSWNFLRSKFSQPKIAVLAEQYAQLLEDFAADPHQVDPLQTLLRYEDFAAWYHGQKDQYRQASHVAYWRDQLHGLPELQLPVDVPYDPGMTRREAVLPIHLPEGLRSELHTVLHSRKYSPQVAFIAAFQALLFRYTCQEDIAIGMACPTETASGDFMIIRTDLSENPGFEDLLQRVHDRYTDAQVHRIESFASLLEELQIPHHSADSDMQVFFMFSGEALTSAAESEQSLMRAAELTLVLRRSGQGIQGEWRYNANLFERRTINAMTGHFTTLLGDMLRQPDQSIAQLQLLTEPEAQQILVEWNATETAYPLDTCLHHLVEAQVERTPDAVALVFEDRHLTYRDLNVRANQLASHLRSLGVGPEVFVGISVERSFDMVIGLLGILKAGGAYVPIDPEYPKERVAFMLEDSQVPVLLTQEKFIEALPEHQAQVICLDSDWEQIAREGADNPDSGVTAENLIYAIYTSGSTGKPKGAMNIHRALCNRILWMQEAYQLTPDDCVLQKTPFSFDVSGWEFFWPLIAGARMVIARPGGHKDPAYLVRLIQTQGVTTMHFVPPMLQVFLESPDVERCASLRRVICSGEALPYDLQARFFTKLDADLHNLYGPTEAAIDVTFWQCQRESQRRLVPIGRPIANTQIYVLSPELQPVPVGVPGELLIGGVNLARGYLNRPELTAEKFIPNPFSSDPNSRLYKTGDLVRFLPDGNIEYLGRFDHQVKIRGFRIELGEIEAILNSHPRIRETVILAREAQGGDKRLVAYLVPTDQPGPSMKELRSFLEAQLPEYMVPALFVLLEAFPLTPNGKIDRRALPVPEHGVVEDDYVAPQTETEQLLAGIWAEVLGREQVGIRSNFFELGGHSLMVMQVISRIRKTFGVELALRDLFEIGHIADLAERVIAKQLEGVAADDLEQLLSDTDDLSDDEIARLLNEDDEN